MIGVFDSGLGGRVTLEYLQQELPGADFLYLGDTKNLPYGDKDPQFLKERTFECLEWMFAQGCELIILACNTASAYAIRPWQEQFPQRKVLSVTVPGLEKMVEMGSKKPVLFATKATIESGIYPSVIHRLYPEYDVSFIAVEGVGLVERLERGIGTFELVQNLFGRVRHEDYDAVILGCTHYPLIEEQIQEVVGKRITLINPGKVSANKLKEYLKKHPDIIVGISGRTELYCTGTGNTELLHIDL